MTTIAPLPNLGLCTHCEGEIRIRKNGTLHAHGCTGDGTQPAAILEPTFARWLHSQSKGRTHGDRIQGLAQQMFFGCTRQPRKTVQDVTWTTAEELHDYQHELQKARTGSDICQPYNGVRCDWLCRDIQAAGHAYAALRQERASA